MCFRSGRQDRTGLIAAAFAADVKLKVALLLSNRSATGRDCSRVRGRPPKKIGPNLGKPPPERSGGLHNAPTVTLPACYFASTARRYLPSSAYFAYALDGSFDKISPMCSMEVPACHAPSEVDGQAKNWKPSM